jgi:Flp pilus assembly protein TadD
MFSASIFALHPINTEAVSYISQRSELLSAFFYLVAVMFFIKSMEAKKTSARLLFYVAMVITFCFALGSKISAISLPLVVVVYDFLFSERKGLLERLKFYSPLFAGALVIVIVFLSGTRSSTSIGFFMPGIDSFNYLYTQFCVIGTYIRLLLFPFNQNLDYDYVLRQSLFEWDVMISMILISGIIAAAFIVRKKYGIVSFGILWFFITLSPTSSFVPVVDVIFEHRVYLPSVGFSLFLAGATIRAFEGLQGFVDRKIVSLTGKVAAAVLIISLCLLTIQRNEAWVTRIAMWTDVAEKSPTKPRAFMNLGQALSEKGHYKESLIPLMKAAAMEVDYSVTKAEIYREIGVSYFKMKKIDEAIRAYNMGRGYSPTDPALLNNLAIALSEKGEIMQARNFARLSVQANPSFGHAYTTLGTLYFKQGEYREAATHFIKAIEFNPDVPLRYWNAALSFERLGDYEKAYIYFQKYLDIETDESGRKNALSHLSQIKQRWSSN